MVRFRAFFSIVLRPQLPVSESAERPLSRPTLTLGGSPLDREYDWRSPRHHLRSPGARVQLLQRRGAARARRQQLIAHRL